jgi:hypothetical protein
LQVDAVASTRWMRQEHLDLAAVPGIDQIGVQLARVGEPLPDALDLVAEHAEHQRRPVVPGMNVGEQVEPAVVQLLPVTRIIIHGAGTNLYQTCRLSRCPAAGSARPPPVSPTARSRPRVALMQGIDEPTQLVVVDEIDVGGTVQCVTALPDRTNNMLDHETARMLPQPRFGRPYGFGDHQRRHDNDGAV